MWIELMWLSGRNLGNPGYIRGKKIFYQLIGVSKYQHFQEDSAPYTSYLIC
jgi:hypothetical protein